MGVAALVGSCPANSAQTVVGQRATGAGATDAVRKLYWPLMTKLPGTLLDNGGDYRKTVDLFEETLWGLLYWPITPRMSQSYS